MRTKLIYVGRGVLNLIVLVAVLIGAQAMIRGRVPDLLGLTIMSGILLLTYLAGVRWIEGRRPDELLHPAGGMEWLSGLALGIGLFSTVMLVLWMAGIYHPTGRGSAVAGAGAASLAAGFLAALLAAVSEEIIFRGFLFRLTEKLAGMWGALALTSILFGAAHAFNKGATVGSSVAIALEAGVLLGAAFALTGRLWLPIGLHLGWNFAEGSIFGMSVSGLEKKQSLINGEVHGSNVLTGGAFGPEASIVAVIVCLCAALVILWKAVRSQQTLDYLLPQAE